MNDEHWIVGGHDGPAVFVYDENSEEDEAECIKVYGPERVALALRLCDALNTYEE